MKTPTGFPLQWPKAWPRTERRESSRFEQSVSGALNNLRRQIELMGGKNVVLSSNASLGNERPSDPAVVAYFELRGLPMAIPCDRWAKIEDNIHAIALTVEAMRGMERWGAKHMITAMFSGFKALPEKGSGIDPWKVLGIAPESSEIEITAAFKNKAKVFHPDKGGSAEDWATLREAHDLALQNVRNK